MSNPVPAGTVADRHAAAARGLAKEGGAFAQEVGDFANNMGELLGLIVDRLVPVTPPTAEPTPVTTDQPSQPPLVLVPTVTRIKPRANRPKAPAPQAAVQSVTPTPTPTVRPGPTNTANPVTPSDDVNDPYYKMGWHHAENHGTKPAFLTSEQRLQYDAGFNAFLAQQTIAPGEPAVPSGQADSYGEFHNIPVQYRGEVYDQLVASMDGVTNQFTRDNLIKEAVTDNTTKLKIRQAITRDTIYDMTRKRFQARRLTDDYKSKVREAAWRIVFAATANGSWDQEIANRQFTVELDDLFTAYQAEANASNDTSSNAVDPAVEQEIRASVASVAFGEATPQTMQLVGSAYVQELISAKVHVGEPEGLANRVAERTATDLQNRANQIAQQCGWSGMDDIWTGVDEVEDQRRINSINAVAIEQVVAGMSPADALYEVNSLIAEGNLPRKSEA